MLNHAAVAALVIILIIIILFAISAKNESEYRLGDFVAQHGGFHRKWKRRVYMIFRSKKSIVYRYGSQTQERWNLAVLSRIVDDIMQEHGMNPVQFAIHLRLGDVIDNHVRSVHDFLHDEDERQRIPHKCDRRSCKSEGYVKPLSYYTFVASLKPQNIMLISGSHRKTKHPHKSQSYLQVLKDYLETHGHAVTVPWNKPPDLDFAILATAGTLIGSGGNFSTLAQAVNSHRRNQEQRLQ